MNRALIEYYRCAEENLNFRIARPNSRGAGYFLFGQNTICFGSLSSKKTAKSLREDLYDATADTKIEGQACYLSFDPTSVVDNLRLERYVDGFHESLTARGMIRDLYYVLRPLMPVGFRKHLQRRHFRGWEGIPFPRWPLDRTVEQILEALLKLSIKLSGATSIPFIWFWPDRAPGCAIVTHDVEDTAGRDFCGALMDIDDAFNIKSSFHIIPEGRYSVSERFLSEIRNRGFEINIHDLNHDGHLFSNRGQFMQRADRINRYAKEFDAHGFRAGQLYRNQEWLNHLDFSYDMSVPNVAHLDPQRGGCCTVMPYFNGRILELPLTTTQDYQYIHILGNSSLDLWKEQMGLIFQGYGLASFLIHPDYVIKKREQDLYRKLLSYLSNLRTQSKIWIALPGEVDLWWRQRSRMSLVQDGTGWKVTGPGSERARLAYASLLNDNLVYHDEAGKEIAKIRVTD